MKTDHRKRHAELHASLDELLACFLNAHRKARPSTTTVLELMKWSFEASTVEGTCAVDEATLAEDPGS